MAGVNAKNVLTGAPDQATTGAISSAKNPSALPTEVTGPFAPEFVSTGYVNEDGLTLKTERSTEAIKEWGGSIVRQILSEFNGTLAWSHLETNEESLRNYFGDENVTVTEATASQGKRITALLKAAEMPRKAWFFRMKDGENRVLIVIPDGQITETGEVSFVKSGAIEWPVTLTTYPDASGNNAYFYFDDGQVLVAAAPSVTTALPSAAAAGDQVTLTGTRFTAATGVKFGAVAAPSYTVVNDSTIVVVVPAGTAGSAPVTVTNATGTSTALAYTRG